MAGLLDYAKLNDPNTLLGVSLLAAANSGQGFGQGLLGAINNVSAQQQEQMRNKLLQSQIDENSSQAEIRKQQLALAQQKQGLLSSIFGGGSGGGPLAGVSTAGGISMPQPSGGFDLGNMSVNQIAALKANGIDVADLWKTAKEGFKRDSGAYYQDVNGNERYYPQLDRGMAIQNGQVSLAPGYAQSNANIKGLEAQAVAAANYPYTVGTDAARQNLAARLDPVKTYNSQTGRDELVPRAAVVGGSPQFSGPGYAGGSSANAANEQVRIIQSELERLPANHPDRPAIIRELQRLGSQAAPAQSGNYAAGPTAAESAANEARRVQAVEQTKADITPTAQKISAVTTARDALGVIDQALQHPGLKTATGLSGAMDPRNYISGTDATNFRVLMDQIRGGVFLDAYKDLRGGGAITEVEGQKAEAAKARINRAQSPDEFVKGLQEYRSIVDRGYERARQQLPANTGGASGSWDAPSSAQQAPRATMRFNPQTGRLEKVN